MLILYICSIYSCFKHAGHLNLLCIIITPMVHFMKQPTLSGQLLYSRSVWEFTGFARLAHLYCRSFAVVQKKKHSAEKQKHLRGHKASARIRSLLFSSKCTKERSDVCSNTVLQMQQRKVNSVCDENCSELNVPLKSNWRTWLSLWFSLTLNQVYFMIWTTKLKKTKTFWVFLL